MNRRNCELAERNVDHHSRNKAPEITQELILKAWLMLVAELVLDTDSLGNKDEEVGDVFCADDPVSDTPGLDALAPDVGSPVLVAVGEVLDGEFDTNVVITDMPESLKAVAVMPSKAQPITTVPFPSSVTGSTLLPPVESIRVMSTSSLGPMIE